MRSSLVRKLVGVVFVATSFVAGVGVEPASAINPNQTTATGVVYYLGGGTGSIDAFWRASFAAWGWSYSKPPIYWYNRWSGDDYSTPCGHTSYKRNNAYYCSGRIYIDQRYFQSLVNRFGDYAAGGMLAHEWGHYIQATLNPRLPFDVRGEYYADCLAGMYTRWGYKASRLVGSDYWEFHNWLLSTPTSTTHGSPQVRTQWYRYGYDQYNLNACNQAWS